MSQPPRPNPARSPLGRRAALTLASVLLLLTGLAAAGPAPAGAQDADQGSATWGTRTSYRNYINGPIAKGTTVASDGATWTAGPGAAKGPFTWPVVGATFDPATETGEITFAGTVATGGHDYGNGPIVELTWSNLRLAIDGDVGTLHADLDFRPFVGASPDVTPPPRQQVDDLAFADLDLSGVDWTAAADGSRTIAAAPTTGVASTMELIGWDLFYRAEMPTIALDAFSVTFTPDEAPDGPALAVSKTRYLAAGETVTVTGSGFTDTAAGTRPPLVGRSGGVYVVVGKFADPWRPSEGAPATARTVIDQKWALPAESRAVVDPLGTDDRFIDLAPDGSFTTELTVDESDAPGAYGIYTYPGSGATEAAHELAVPISFGTAPPPTTAPPGTTPPPTTAPPTTVAPPDEDVVITGGSLDWGVRSTFRQYVTGPIAQGSVSTGGAAGTGPAGTYRFPVRTGGVVDLASGRVDADFDGSVNFNGHGGQLDLTIADPSITFDGDAGTLRADVESLPLDGDEVATYDDVVLGTLDLRTVRPGLLGDDVAWVDVPVTLTASGAPAFSDFYAAGEALDPLTVRLRLSAVPDLPPITDADPDPADRVVLDRTTVRAGETLGVSGAGFLPGEQVEIWLLSEPEFLAPAVADADGVVAETVTIPLETVAGVHHVEMRAISSERVLTSDDLTVLAADLGGPGAGAGVGPGGAPLPIGSALPRTGSDPTTARLGVVTLLVGTALVAAARRRRLAPGATPGATVR